MSHAKSWIRIDDFTMLFKYGGTEMGQVSCSPWNVREWTIKPSFEADVGFIEALRDKKYSSLGEASQSLVDLWSIQAALEASLKTGDWLDEESALDMYQSWMDSVLNSFNNHCGGSD